MSPLFPELELLFHQAPCRRLPQAQDGSPPNIEDKILRFRKADSTEAFGDRAPRNAPHSPINGAQEPLEIPTQLPPCRCGKVEAKLKASPDRPVQQFGMISGGNNYCVARKVIDLH